MINGFFAPYAYLGVMVFSAVIIFVFLLGWLANKIFKNKWALPLISFFSFIFFYFIDVKFLAYTFLLLSILISIILVVYNFIIKTKK